MITAGEVLSNLDWRRRTAQLRLLDELRDPEREAVKAALAKLPPDSKVDLGRLIDEMRRKAAENAAKANSHPFRYELTLLPIAELKALREDALARIARGEGSQPWSLREARDRLARRGSAHVASGGRQ
jgi:hypothetical protein